MKYCAISSRILLAKIHRTSVKEPVRYFFITSRKFSLTLASLCTYIMVLKMECKIYSTVVE